MNDKDLSQQAKDFLSQIHKTDALINRLVNTVATLRSSLTSTGSQLKQDKVQTSGPKNTLEEGIARIDELERTINIRIDELIDLKQTAFMGVVLNTFESMQQASGRAVDTAAIREAREEWAKAGTAFDAIEENIRNANNEQQKFNNSIRGGNNSANGLLSTIKKIAVAAGGIVGINKVQNISDKLASTKARLNLLVDDGGSVDVLEQKIMASAQRSRSVYFDTASAVAKLGLNAGNAFNGDMNQVIAFMEQVNKQFVIGGATAQEQSNAMIQLTMLSFPRWMKQS